MLLTNIVVELDCGTSLDKQDMKGEDRGVLRSPSCSQAISPKMPFSNIQSLLPGKHVEIGLMINWNECHARFHVFQSMLLEFFPDDQMIIYYITISIHFPTLFSLLILHLRSWVIGRSWKVIFCHFRTPSFSFLQGGQTIGSITGKQSTIAQGS